uniref:uncharacterized protein LOC124050319 isoform X13 n=1 Tax=Scatophagus argus TaxID=75038 RepID=UPI001ED81420|nr:uncharacterized protein LOC124050319 isoform X13 [Scatophagus argus]
MSLILMLLLQFPAVTGQYYSSFVVGDGEEVTLPCDNRRADLHRCDEIDWLFIDLENRATVLLVKRGQIGEQAKTKSDRLSVTNSCSLVIKKVSAEDAGRYTCRQSGHQDVNVDLSVVTMTEREDADEVTLSCSVVTYERCGHTVKWLNEGEEVNEGEDDMKTSGSDCSVTVTLRSSFVKQKSKYREQFRCEVTDEYTDTVQQFTFRHQSSGEKPAVTGQRSPHFVVGDGEEVTLPCDNRRADLHRCDEIDWIFADHGNRAAVLLVERGQIGEQARTKSDRLSVTKNCSLVIKKVSAEDVGRYTCRQSGHQDFHVDLSVVTMTEREDADEVTLSCSVVTYGPCGHTVKWLNEGKEVNEGEDDMKTSGSDCSVTVTLRSSFVKQKSKYREQFRCEVTDRVTQTVQQFTFRHQSSALWVYIVAAMGFAVLVMIIVLVIRCRRPKGNKTQQDDSTGRSLNPAARQPVPESRQDTADPEDGVSYASITYTKKTSKAQVQVKNDYDEGDMVTYSTVKASSPSAGASDDSSNLYASINKPNQ